ncbi:MAG TPA: penicillin-binding protein 2 [Candidatus Kapabacteria bacterium]|nr:penicillin-binding protein 2 [Candidatus Kapabacteria bacterium]
MKSIFKRQYTTDWVESSFSFEQSIGRQIPVSTRKEYVGSSFTRQKAVITLGVVGCIFLFFIGKIFYLQILSGDSYRAGAEQNRERILPIVAERGIIYDRNGAALTKNIPNFSLAIVPQDLPRKATERETVVERLSQITGQPIETIRETIEAYKSYRFESIVIQEDIDYEQALRILIDASDLPGISVQRGSKRLYLPTTATSTDIGLKNEALAFAHVLGYVGKLNREELDAYYSRGYLPSDSIGKTGIEKSYEQALRGTYGKKRVEVNALGREQSVLSEDPPVPGLHLTLSIDKEIQVKLYDILDATLKRTGKARATAIALDPSNGEVLAMVSTPSFDNNDFSGGISTEKYTAYISNEDRPLFPRAISGVYPSGSVVKPAIAAAALEEGIITPETSFLSNGGLRVGSWFFPDWQAGGHGITNVRRSLAWSVNTFYYYVGGGYGSFTGLGVEKIVEYLKKFGFAQPLGIDLPGEAAGFLPTKEWKKNTKGEQWYIGDTYNVSIGQGDLLVTPLHIAAMTASIANNGTLYQPHVVRFITNPITKTTEPKEPQVILKDFIHPEHLRTVRLGMRDCALSGSCRRLATLPVNVAGKTGTAQWNSNKANHAWFTSFAPFEQPEIVLTVLVEEGGEGSSIAVPIAHEFYQWWAGYRVQE